MKLICHSWYMQKNVKCSKFDFKIHSLFLGENLKIIQIIQTENYYDNLSKSIF